MYGLLLLLMIRSLKKSLKLWISPPTTCWSLIWKQTNLKYFFLNICFLICCLNTATTQFNQIRKKTSTPKIESDWGPLHLHMSPVDRTGPLTGTNLASGSYEKIQPGFRDEKRPKILGTSFGANLLEKQNKRWRNATELLLLRLSWLWQPF